MGTRWVTELSMRSPMLLLVLTIAQSAALVVPNPSLNLPHAMLAARSPTGYQMKEVVRVEVEIEQGEPLEKALRRFRKATNMSGHLRILRNRKMFESTHDKKIRKTKESLMRRARARRAMRGRM